MIDYYSAPPEPDGSPVFSLDVRPALDSVGSIKQRIAAATEDVAEAAWVAAAVVEAAAVDEAAGAELAPAAALCEYTI